MPYMDFTQSPSYQRMMLKIKSVRPEQRAILNTLSVDEEFADQATRNALKLMAQKNDKEYTDKSIAQRVRADAQSAELNRAELASNMAGRASDRALKSQSNALNYGLKMMELESGLASRAAERDIRAKANAVNLDLDRQRFDSGIGLKRREYDYDRDQNRLADLIGLGQVLYEADYGGRRDALDLETYRRKMGFANRLYS